MRRRVRGTSMAGGAAALGGARITPDASAAPALFDDIADRQREQDDQESGNDDRSRVCGQPFKH